MQYQTRRPALPELRILPTDYVHIYAFIGNGKAVKAYEARFYGEMAKLQTQGACRYIVDLRGNDGSNMWPMLNGVAPLLGDSPFGRMVSPLFGLKATSPNVRFGA